MPRRERELAGLLLAVAVSLSGCDRLDMPRPPLRGAILILLDTLRADHVSAYGHGRPTSPTLDRLAEGGVLFEQAISYSAWTLPSMAAILSGRFPARRDFDTELKRSLVERLSDAGWRTAAFTEGGYVSRYFGFDRGFDTWSDHADMAIGLKRSLHDLASIGIETTFPAAEAWLRGNSDRPFFLLIHTYEVHVPYRRRSFAEELPRGSLNPFVDEKDVTRIRSGQLVLGDTEYAYLDALYDGGILWADRAIASLLGVLRELEIADSTLVVVTSDHGEDLGDHAPRFAADHGHSLADILVRVPLIVYDPTREFSVARVAHQVRTVDILPTILDLLGVDRDGDADGRSLVPLMEGSENSDRIAFAHLRRYGREVMALRVNGFKLIRGVSRRADAGGEGRPEAGRPLALFDLGEDPAERRNLLHTHPNRLRHMMHRVDAILEEIGEPGIAEFTVDDSAPPELIERLKALGYTE